jgi:hypothetical protein
MTDVPTSALGFPLPMQQYRHITTRLPLPSLRDVGNVLVDIDGGGMNREALSEGTHKVRLLFILYNFLRPHEHGGGVFHPHPPPYLLPIPSLMGSPIGVAVMKWQ